jgi:hypothetical protein
VHFSTLHDFALSWLFGSALLLAVSGGLGHFLSGFAPAPADPE